VTPISSLITFHVLDDRGHRARLADLVVDIGTDRPEVTRLVVDGNEQVAADGLRVSIARRELQIESLARRTSAVTADERPRVPLLHALLDKLVIDLSIRGPARVNDILLDSGGQGLRLRAIDTSTRGVLRRLTRGRWPVCHEGALTDWRDVVFLRGTPGHVTDSAGCRRIGRLPPGEIGRLSNALPYLHAAELIGALPHHVGAEVLEVLPPQRQLQVFDELSDDGASQLLPELAPDTVADLLTRLEPAEARQHLRRLPDDRRRLVTELLQYPEDTVGALMTNDVVAVPEDITLSEACQLLHDSLATPAFVYYVYVVDGQESRRLRGMVTLRELLTAESASPIREAMNPYLAALTPLSPAAPACQEVIDNRVQALPVVGEDGRLLGALTADAALAHIGPPGWRSRTRYVFS
jgi:CBS domain-containing protein